MPRTPFVGAKSVERRLNLMENLLHSLDFHLNWTLSKEAYSTGIGKCGACSSMQVSK